MAFIDYALIILYCFGVLYCGVRVGKDVNTLKDYAIGGRDFSTMAVVSTIYATGVGATAIKGMLMLGYTYGFRVLIYHDILELLGFIFIVVIAAKHIHKFYGMISVGDLIGSVYGRKAKIISGIFSILACYVTVTGQIVAGGMLLEYFLGISFTTSLILSSMITTTYTAFGGIRGVVWTDIIQLSLMVLSMPLLFSLIVSCIGGYHEFFSGIQPQHLNFSVRDPVNRTWLGIGIVNAIPALLPATLQRLLMTSSRMQVKQVFARLIPARFMTSTLLFAIGIAFFIFKQKTGAQFDIKFMLEYFIDTHVPPFFKGFILIGIMSALMSTADSMLNTISIAAVNDIIRPIWKDINEDKALRLAKIITFIIGVSSVCLALVGDSIVYLRILKSNLWSSTVLIPLLFVIVGFKTVPLSFYSAIACGLTTSCAIRVFWHGSAFGAAFPGAVASLMGFLVAHYFCVVRSKVHGGIKCDEEDHSRDELRDLIKLADGAKRKNLFKKFINKCISFSLTKYVRGDILRNGAEDTLLPIFIIATSIFPVFMCDGSISSDNSLLTIKYLSSIIGLIVIFRHKMPSWYQKHWEVFWHIFLIFSLPFQSLLLLLLNSGGIYWHISMYLAIFLLSVAVSRGMFLVDSLVGWGAALCFYSFYKGSCDPVFFRHDVPDYYITYGYVFSLLIAVLFAKRQQLRDAERTDAYIKASSIISHEISSPIGVLLCSLTRIENVLKRSLLEDNEKCECSSAIGAARVTVSNIDNFMTLFLRNIKNAEDFVAFDLSRISLKKVVEDLLTYYPLHERKNEIIKVNYENNFDVLGNELLITQSLLNVIKNSLFFISGVRGGGITITFSQPHNSEYNIMEVTDTGIGMPERVVENIFKKFYTQRDGGSGLGLFFCACAMNRMGGIMECESKVGQFTSMIFKFPKMEIFRNL